MKEILENIQTEEMMGNTNMNLLKDQNVSEREITKYELNSKFIPMVDKMRHLEVSADQTDPSMMCHKQMPGVAIEIFLRQQMGDLDD